MSIRILADSEIKSAASSFHAPALLFANPKNLYHRRAKRFRQLAQDNPFADYLLFAANLAECQLAVLESTPIADMTDEIAQRIAVNQGKKPLNAKTFMRTAEWRTTLLALITQFKPYANETCLATLEWLEKAAASELETLADHLLHEQFEIVGADKAVFLWSALSLYFVQLAQQLPRNVQADYGEHRYTCPVCDNAPVASVIHFGETQGLRYLHCALCESEWNMVRAKCSNCEQTGKLDYWSLNTLEAAVKAESCGDCESYLKVLYQDKDPHVEPMADDLATLFLDAEMEQKGLSRSGLNPFLFQMSS